jgi:hypothetical protein
MSSFSIILLMISSSCIILLIIEQLQLSCRLISLYCSSISSRDFHVVFKYYCLRLAVLVLCCSSLSSCDLQVDLYYYTAHRWAVLILYSSSLSSCNFHVDLYSGILATPIILWDLAAGKAAWDHTRSFLRHPCRLWLRHHADFTSAWLPTRFVVS